MPLERETGPKAPKLQNTDRFHLQADHGSLKLVKKVVDDGLAPDSFDSLWVHLSEHFTNRPVRLSAPFQWESEYGHDRPPALPRTSATWS